MKIAYLMNTYPMTSTTFVRREIEALERSSVDVKRYAVRVWPHKLVDERDLTEATRTHYMLTRNTSALLLSFSREIITNPGGLCRALTVGAQLAVTAKEIIKPMAYLMQAAYLRQMAARDKIEHIHAHFSTNAAAVAMLARRMGGPAYSFTTHGPDEFDEAARNGLGAKLEHAAFAIAISHYCKAKLIQFGGSSHRDKIHIVHCALPLAEFQPAGEISPDNQTLVCVGRLCPQKGQILIPAAVAALRQEFPALKVILIGDGESRAVIEHAIEHHRVAAHIELRGWMANRQVHDIVRQARAFLLPSFAEGLPVVIMEAFALGRPVISTYIAGIPELVDDTCGWLIPASSEEHLVAAMRAALLATPEELSHKAAVGRARIVARFDSDIEAGKLLDLIRSKSSAVGHSLTNSPRL